MDHNTSTRLTPKGFMKTISIIHYALVAGVLALGLVNFLQTAISPDQENNAMTYLFPVFGLMGIFVGSIIFKQMLPKLKTENLLSKKLMGYQTACLIRWALIEGPALLNIVWFGNTGNSLYLAVGATLVIYLTWLRPTKQKLEQELELKGELLNQFKKEDEPCP